MEEHESGGGGGGGGGGDGGANMSGTLGQAVADELRNVDAPSVMGVMAPRVAHLPSSDGVLLCTLLPVSMTPPRPRSSHWSVIN